MWIQSEENNKLRWQSLETSKMGERRKRNEMQVEESSQVIEAVEMHREVNR